MSALDLHEMPVSAVLEEYNRLRTEKGMPLITSWKESKTKLLDAIARLDPVDLKKAERPIRRPSVKAEQPTKKPKDAASFTLADLARDHSIDPKVLRAKARRHAEQLGALHDGKSDKWTFPASSLTKVLSILKLVSTKKEAA